MPNEKYLTLKEVADILRVSERSILRYIEADRLKASKIGGWRISESDLREFVEESKK